MSLGDLPRPGAALSAWVRAQRPAAERIAVATPPAFLEPERAADGRVVRTATLLLQNRECPWACLMCDLWKHTLPGPTPPGFVPAQIALGLAGLEHVAEHIKLYNSGSFFDPRAVSPDEYNVITAQLAGFRHIVVESHPRLIGARTGDFHTQLRETLGATLEVAVGLETVDPVVLPRLNKGSTLDDFARAAETLHTQGIALRCFVLVRPPFQDEPAALEWAVRSTAHAFALGASVVSLIPTRAGNGAMEALRARGDWAPPSLATLERALAAGLAMGRGRVFADTWNLPAEGACAACLPARLSRLHDANLAQSLPPAVVCITCGGSAG